MLDFVKRFMKRQKVIVYIGYMFYTQSLLCYNNEKYSRSLLCQKF